MKIKETNTRRRRGIEDILIARECRTPRVIAAEMYSTALSSAGLYVSFSQITDLFEKYGEEKMAAAIAVAEEFGAKSESVGADQYCIMFPMTADIRPILAPKGEPQWQRI